MNLEELKRKVIDFRDERDWEQFHTLKNLILSINVEAGELGEIFQWNTEEEAKKLLKDPKKFKELKHELADVIIYCLYLAYMTNINLEKAVLEKIYHNNKNYPKEKAKGNAIKYTER